MVCQSSAGTLCEALQRQQVKRWPLLPGHEQVERALLARMSSKNLNVKTELKHVIAIV